MLLRQCILSAAMHGWESGAGDTRAGKRPVPVEVLRPVLRSSPTLRRRASVLTTVYPDAAHELVTTFSAFGSSVGGVIAFIALLQGEVLLA